MTMNSRALLRRLDDMPPAFPAILAVCVVLIAVVLIRQAMRVEPVVSMTPVRVASPPELEILFETEDYQWPPSGPVPRLELQNMPPEMNELRVQRKKALFFRAILPLVLAENRRIEALREFIQQAGDISSLSQEDRTRLRSLAARYKVTGDLSDPEEYAMLLRRVDSVPPALALAQAANESAWGSSRFVREANNLFGIWTWDQSMGVLPQRREAGRKHLVRAYPDLRTAVRAYMLTLNTGHAYVGFRQSREAMRKGNRELDAGELAGHLGRYSERGAAYIKEIRSMIRSNRLSLANDLRLAG